jgi:hypothetical protein
VIRMAAHREAVRERNTGPQHVSISLAAYLAAEQKLGRIHPDANPDAGAALLVGACLQHAFLNNFTDTYPDEATTVHFVHTLVATLTRELPP